MKNLHENALMQEMTASEKHAVNGGWDLESATVAAATASICAPLNPAFVAAAFIIGGFFEL